MGWPLFLLGAWLTFLIVRPVMSSDQTDSKASNASS
jgi:hypothetical protein